MLNHIVEYCRCRVNTKPPVQADNVSLYFGFKYDDQQITMSRLLSVLLPALDSISFHINCAGRTLTKGPRVIKIKDAVLWTTEYVVQNRLKTRGGRFKAGRYSSRSTLVKRRNLSYKITSK